ncbi:hypothetical protein BASA81_017404 [Batrachochytrium salamandrivorans]|nr:hypothetical protein BASA62_002490 [Batrachochytrium salamandrivorans]KAH9245127.1 hypothetical protein BASA81_017404 [Batrachochytrium salamandrivorans]
MSDPFVTILRAANISAISALLWTDAQATQPASDMDLTTHVSFAAPVPVSSLAGTSTDTRSFSTTDAAGYKDYDIWTVLFFWKKKDLDHPSYLRLLGKSSGGRDVAPVSFIDRKDLLDYLGGIADVSANIRSTGSSKPRPDVSTEAIVDLLSHEAFMSEFQRKRMLVSDKVKQDLEHIKRLRKVERPVNTTASVLSVTGPKSFVIIQKLAADKFTRETEESRLSLAPPTSALPTSVPPTRASSTRAPSTSVPSKHVRSTKTDAPVKKSSQRSSQKSSRHTSKQATEAMPIILVPAAAQSVLTLYNIKEFLIDQKFTPTETYRNRGENKPTQVILERDPFKISPDVQQKFLVLDSVETMKHRDWDRVVAVFAMGQVWQFRGWKWEKPVEIFHNILGFTLKFVDEPPPGLVPQWKVEVLNIHRSKRYLDGTVVYSFWQLIDGFIRGQKASVFQ